MRWYGWLGLAMLAPILYEVGNPRDLTVRFLMMMLEISVIVSVLLIAFALIL